MEHDLVLVYPGVEALLARHVGPDVQSPAVASPVLECDSVTQQGEELQESLTAGLVAQQFVVHYLPRLGIDDSKLEVHVPFLLLQPDDVLLNVRVDNFSRAPLYLV